MTLGAAHEGAPDRSHGGIVAGLIDDTYGFVLQLLGEMAFTGELAIRYEAGVPIGEPLVCRAELDRREGRKLFMRAVLTIGATGEVLVRSTATFIAVNPAALLAGLTT